MEYYDYYDFDDEINIAVREYKNTKGEVETLQTEIDELQKKQGVLIEEKNKETNDILKRKYDREISDNLNEIKQRDEKIKGIRENIQGKIDIAKEKLSKKLEEKDSKIEMSEKNVEAVRGQLDTVKTQIEEIKSKSDKELSQAIKESMLMGLESKQAEYEKMMEEFMKNSETLTLEKMDVEELDTKLSLSNMDNFIELWDRVTQESVKVQNPVMSTPDPTQTKPEPTPTTPDPTQTKPGTTQTTPDPTQTKPGTTQTTPDPTQTKPGTTQTTPDPTQTKPGTTQTKTGTTQTKTGTTQTKPGTTQTKPGTTQTKPGATKTTPESKPNIGKPYGKLDLDSEGKDKDKDKHIRQITCEVGLGKYFVEFNDGTLETVNANVLSKKEAKSVFDVYDIDKKSNIDPNIISILLNYADKNLIGDPKKFVQEYVKEPNRDVPVVYSDKLTSRHGKIMMGKETLEDTLLVGKQDNPVKPLKRFEKRFLRQMASKQREHKNTYLLMDERNVFKKMFDAVLSKIGKEPTFLLEETQKNEASISALNSKRMNEISENVNDKINSINKPEMEEENVKKYTDQKKEAWKKSLRQYNVRNVLQAPNPFINTKKVDEEIIDNAKQGFTDRLNDPYARTKEMLDKKINEAKEENEEER